MPAPVPDVPSENRSAVISDPRALRALAHAGRAKILERLTVYGPATATECAQEVGMSPSACSYHLRLLQRYGFVAEAHDEERTDGRERLWRAVVTSWRSKVSDDTDPQTMQSIDMALARVQLASSDEHVLAWVDQSAQEGNEWHEASLISNSTLAADAEELKELHDRIQELLRPYRLGDRRPQDLPAGTRLVHAAVRLVPTTGPAPRSTPEQSR
ncbi:ArsR/SmtB family transcription factor [Terrabacter sp. BE26]|uniref:ArsR/SmtB family transcription factor n=1 Tax=Terrabacter sp. BE26 TaxID=2898152 RepID=UPI0035BE4BCF